MDYLRKCYVTRVRPFAGSNETAEVRWYWAPEGAPVLRGAIWRSSFWYVSDLDGQYPPPPPIGEERSVPFRWSPGQLGQRLAVGKCVVGDRSWFATGIPPEANVPHPPPLPACCSLPVRVNLGGFLLGGRVQAVPIVQGGLLAGGEAIRTLLEASGGLMLGGVTSAFVSFAVGGLLIGGVVSPDLLDAEGGLLIGGVVSPDLLDAEGGLLIGGLQETEPAPVGLGGLWIGGEAQEPMALLYCSLRLSGFFNIPNNAATKIQWDTVEADPSGMFTLGVPTRITVPVAGVYLVQHQLYWPYLSGSFNLSGELLKNGGDQQYLYGGGSSAVGFTIPGGAAMVELSAGDYLEVNAYQNSGITQTPGIVGPQKPCFRVAALAPDPPSGRLLGIQRITTPGAYTYTPTTGTASVIVELQGGGGGGGGAPTAGAGNRSLGGGGAGGSWLRKRLTANFSGATGVVGTGGTGGNNAGGGGSSGTATTFITSGGGPVTYTAPGGSVGFGGFAQAPSRIASPVAGSAVSGGDDNVTGGAATAGIGTNNLDSVSGGGGGFSRYSPGAAAVCTRADNASIAGANADGFGGGGGGAAVSGTGAARTGGNGSGGLVVIWEYS